MCVLCCVKTCRCCCCGCLLTQIAGGYYGSSNAATAVATTGDNKGKGRPLRLLTAYIVRPGKCEGRAAGDGAWMRPSLAWAHVCCMGLLRESLVHIPAGANRARPLSRFRPVLPYRSFCGVIVWLYVLQGSTAAL